MWIALTGATLILAACTTGDPAAPADPTPSPPAATSTPAPTTITTSPGPTSALSDEEAAKQAVLRLISTLNDALQTRSTTELKKAFIPGCQVCERDVATVDQARASGRTFVGGTAQVTTLAVRTKTGPRVLLHATVSRSALSLKDASGNVVASEPASTDEKSVVVLETDGGWVVEGLT